MVGYMDFHGIKMAKIAPQSKGSGFESINRVGRPCHCIALYPLNKLSPKVVYAVWDKILCTT